MGNPKYGFEHFYGGGGGHDPVRSYEYNFTSSSKKYVVAIESEDPGPFNGLGSSSLLHVKKQ